MMLTHVLQPDTQAVLLLCGRFGQSRSQTTQPLSLNEYNALALQLQKSQLRPGDLLTSSGRDWVRLAMPVRGAQSRLNNSLEPERLLSLLDRGAMLAVAVEGWTNRGLWILSRGDEDYPQQLKRKLKHRAPAILYGIGDKLLLSGGGLAIVGSRDLDEEGTNYAERVAQKCAEESIPVISGGAKGVDSVAMLAAVALGGKVVGVLAANLTKTALSKAYREAIGRGDATLVSPYDPDAGFNVGNAMNRNQYIYGLSDRALVVDASENKGGTWAGATEELKRENSIPVFVRMEGKTATGNRKLLALGAIAFPLTPWNRPLLELLEAAEKLPRSQERSSEVTPSAREIPHNESGLPRDAYEAILPLMLSYLREPKPYEEIAELLNVHKPQAKAWLKQAQKQQRVEQVKEGYYVAKAAQLSLLE